MIKNYHKQTNIFIIIVQIFSIQIFPSAGKILPKYSELANFNKLSNNIPIVLRNVSIIKTRHFSFVNPNKTNFHRFDETDSNSLSLRTMERFNSKKRKIRVKRDECSSRCCSKCPGTCTYECQLEECICPMTIEEIQKLQLELYIQGQFINKYTKCEKELIFVQEKLKEAEGELEEVKEALRYKGLQPSKCEDTSELERVQKELGNLNQTCQNTKNVLIEVRIDLQATNAELDKTKQKLKETSEELERLKNSSNATKPPQKVHKITAQIIIGNIPKAVNIYVNLKIGEILTIIAEALTVPSDNNYERITNIITFINQPDIHYDDYKGVYKILYNIYIKNRHFDCYLQLVNCLIAIKIAKEIIKAKKIFLDDLNKEIANILKQIMIDLWSEIILGGQEPLPNFMTLERYYVDKNLGAICEKAFTKQNALTIRYDNILKFLRITTILDNEQRIVVLAYLAQALKDNNWLNDNRITKLVYAYTLIPKYKEMYMYPKLVKSIPSWAVNLLQKIGSGILIKHGDRYLASGCKYQTPSIVYTTISTYETNKDSGWAIEVVDRGGSFILKNYESRQCLYASEETYSSGKWIGHKVDTDLKCSAIRGSHWKITPSSDNEYLTIKNTINNEYLVSSSSKVLTAVLEEPIDKDGEWKFLFCLKLEY